MRRYVLDASVAAKWFLNAPDETLVEEANQLLGHYLTLEAQLVVPDLFFAEFANIFWKAERRGRCDPRTTDAALAQMFDLHLPTFPTAPFVKPAAAIARAYGRTVYDSLYLALAVEVEAVLITADARLANSLQARLPILYLGAL